MQNFDLGPSLVDEVMKAFSGSGKSQRAEISPARTCNTREHSSAVTTPCRSEEFKTSVDSSDVYPSDNTVVSALEETIVSTVQTDRDMVPNVRTSVAGTENSDSYCLQNGTECRKSAQMPTVSSKLPRRVSDTQFDGDVATNEIWQHRQQRILRNKSEQLSGNIPKKNTHGATSLVAGSKYPVVIGSCSLSPRTVCPRDSTARGLMATKSNASATLTSSSEERLPAGSSGQDAASLVAASSSSLPARSSFIADSWSKLPRRLPATKAPSTDSSDSESGSFFQRLKERTSLSRLSGFRSSVDSRIAKSGRPTETHLNVNVHFFDRLREQELENSSLGEDSGTKSSPVAESGGSPVRSLSVATSRHLPSRHLDNSRSCPVSEARISETCETESNGVESIGSKVDVVSPITSSHHELARLSCRSTESRDSVSHDSEHSSTTTQPSDEGVYSDDSVAASADELQPRTEPRTPTSKFSSAADSAVTLGIINKDDVFWTDPVHFRDLVNIDDRTSPAAERYRVPADMCYEDRMECELNGYVDMCRYFVLIFTVFRLISFHYTFFGYYCVSLVLLFTVYYVFMTFLWNLLAFNGSDFTY